MADIGFEGLERFLHMIEGRLGRWGRPIGTAALVVALVAFALFCIKHIVADGIIPFWHIVQMIKAEPQSAWAITYQFISNGGAIIFWFLIFPILIAFIVGNIIAKYRARAMILDLARGTILANEMNVALDEFSKDLARALTSLNKKGDIKQLYEALQKLMEANSRIRLKVSTFKKETAALKSLPKPLHLTQEQQDKPKRKLPKKSRA
jgi:hypothetical protein